MYQLLLFIKRRLFFRRPPKTPATLGDVLRAANHAQAQLDDLHKRLCSWLLDLDRRLVVIESRIDLVFGILDTAQQIDNDERKRLERVLRVLAESIHADLADLDVRMLGGQPFGDADRAALDRSQRLAAQAALLRDMLAKLSI